MRIRRLELTNFLSYRDAVVEFDDLVALVGPNASGKSNAVAALKLLRDIPEYGLQTAVVRRGGFDQLRHRSEGRPFDPSIKLELEVEAGVPSSRYELHFASVAGGRYVVKLERGRVCTQGSSFEFVHKRGKVTVTGDGTDADGFRPPPDGTIISEGQSALGLMISYGPFYPIWSLLTRLQIIEINPARVRELQEPTPGYDFEPDGSNTASIFETLPPEARTELIDELSAVVPNLDNVEVRRFSNLMTLNFTQRVGGRRRSFLANQMSDGTLRAFAILLALVQRTRPVLVVVEEPEVAIHLGALRTLVDILREHASTAQIFVTTHSADIIDALEVEELRVVWAEDGISYVAPVAKHTRETVRSGLITPGELLRADSLDPSIA